MWFVCVCVCEDDVSLPRQGTTPQILKADISCAIHRAGKRNVSKIN